VRNDGEIRELLRAVRTIAVVGIKAGETDDAYRVPRYLLHHGYRILPVNPRLRRVLELPVAESLAALGEPVDLVDLFRAPQHLPGHVEEILALEPRPRAVWMQLGISHPEAAARLRSAGIGVVEDRCLMTEHQRLLGIGP
jgi:predicted CoA-binding protein